MNQDHELIDPFKRGPILGEHDVLFYGEAEYTPLQCESERIQNFNQLSNNKDIYTIPKNPILLLIRNVPRELKVLGKYIKYETSLGLKYLSFSSFKHSRYSSEF